MEMVRKNRVAKQIDPKTRGETLQLLFDPDLAMIIIVSSDRIVSEQKASADNTVQRRKGDRSFIGEIDGMR